MTVNPDAAVSDQPAELLQRLIRFDTTNPPGGERACIEWIAGVLRAVGIEPRIIAQDPERPNLIARLAGDGKAPPLLLQGHVDVVPARGGWSRPPFAGEVADGYVWGRGALDMKGGVAMMLAAFLRAAASDRPPPGDVLLCLVSDEEAGGDHGARFLVEEHAELFDGVRFAIGEFGGFTLDIAGRRIYPLMVAEKQLCSVRATLRGPGGHGSLPVRNGATGRLGRLLSALDRRRLPVHVTPVVRSMIDAIAAEVPPPAAVPLRALLRPRLSDRLLDGLGDRAQLFDPLLHNTASPRSCVEDTRRTSSPARSRSTSTAGSSPASAPPTSSPSCARSRASTWSSRSYATIPQVRPRWTWHCSKRSRESSGSSTPLRVPCRCCSPR